MKVEPGALPVLRSVLAGNCFPNFFPNAARVTLIVCLSGNGALNFSVSGGKVFMLNHNEAHRNDTGNKQSITGRQGGII